MTLATKRLILRPFTLDDVPAVHHYSKKETVTHFMEWGPNTKQDSENFVKLVIHKARENPRFNYDFLVTLKDGTVIGACGIYFSDPQKAPSLGWVYDDDYWNKGYGTEAAARLLALYFKTLKGKIIRATCVKENIGSVRIMEKIGMRYVETRLRDVAKLGTVEELVYELTALEYELSNHRTYI